MPGPMGLELSYGSDLKDYCISKLKKSDQADFDTKIVKAIFTELLECSQKSTNYLLIFINYSDEDLHIALHLLSMDRTL
jgi:hypothetical protein